jgi:Ras-related protein Rab-21
MVLCVVGNKTDLAAERKVSRDEAFSYAESIGASYFESSALQDQGKHPLYTIIFSCEIYCLCTGIMVY